MSERHALIIGIDAYREQRLLNAVDDATKTRNALRRRGFDTRLVENCDAETLRERLSEFHDRARDARMALIYCAGHAVERQGAGTFLPSDFPFPFSAQAARQHGISVSALVRSARSAQLSIIVIDACRTWPLSPTESLDLDRQMEELAADERNWTNVLLSYSTSATTSAGDGAVGSGSLFNAAFCERVLDHRLSVDECFRRIAEDVTRLSHMRQHPWTYSSLTVPLSFSDLPTFSPLARHNIPSNIKFGAAWCASDFAKEGIYAGMGEPSVWYADLAGVRQVARGPDKIVGTTDIGERVLVAGDTGTIFQVPGKDAPPFRSGIAQCFGLVSSRDGKIVAHYGGKRLKILRVDGTECEEVASLRCDFEVYSCVFVGDDHVWLAGGHGDIVSYDFSKRSKRRRKIASLGHHINAMAVSPRGDLVYCVGQGSLAVCLDLNGRVKKRYLEARRPQTAAGTRAALLAVAHDDVIRRYIFDRDALSSRIIWDLEEHLGYSDFRACAIAPSSPLLAIGTDESTIVLLDTRDGQAVQQIDITATLPGEVPGLVFLDDKTLVAVGSEGQVVYLSA